MFREEVNSLKACLIVGWNIGLHVSRVFIYISKPGMVCCKWMSTGIDIYRLVCSIKIPALDRKYTALSFVSRRPILAVFHRASYVYSQHGVDTGQYSWICRDFVVPLLEDIVKLQQVLCLFKRV